MRKRNGYQAYRGGRHPLRTAFLFLVLLVVLAFGTLEVIIAVGGRTDVEEQPDAMIILGCQVKPWGPSILLQDRLDAAITYLETEEGEFPIIVSGGQGPDEHMSEAQAMYEYLVDHGVDGQRIHLEDQSHNTKENLQNSKKLLGDLGYDPEEIEVLIVSNDFHLTRATMLAERYGMESSRLAAPATHITSKIKMFFSEPLALVKSFLLD